jgi:hypothetical protein
MLLIQTIFIRIRILFFYIDMDPDPIFHFVKDLDLTI